jgi:hypothetical protein
MSMTVSPKLKAFFGQCFHPDWDRSSSDWRRAVSEHLRKLGKQQALAIGVDLMEVLDSSRFSEQDFEYLIFDEFQSFFDPRPGMELGAWLESLMEVIQSWLDGKG